MILHCLITTNEKKEEVLACTHPTLIRIGQTTKRTNANYSLAWFLLMRLFCFLFFFLLALSYATPPDLALYHDFHETENDIDTSPFCYWLGGHIRLVSHWIGKYTFIIRLLSLVSFYLSHITLDSPAYWFGRHRLKWCEPTKDTYGRQLSFTRFNGSKIAETFRSTWKIITFR